MYDYSVNETTGYVEESSKESIVFIKLFPFVLSTFALIGGITKVYWEIHDIRYAAQLSLIVDGLEEAVSELISGLRMIYNNMEQNRKVRLSKVNVNLNTKRRHRNNEDSITIEKVIEVEHQNLVKFSVKTTEPMSDEIIEGQRAIEMLVSSRRQFNNVSFSVNRYSI